MSDAIVGFVEAWSVERGPADAPWTEDRYTATVYRRPLGTADRAIAGCAHEHRSIDAAARCLRRLLRDTTDRLDCSAGVQ